VGTSSASRNHTTGEVRQARQAGAAPYDTETFEDQPVIVVFLEGQTLKGSMAEKPMETAELLERSTQIADALDAAHVQGVAASVRHRPGTGEYSGCATKNLFQRADSSGSLRRLPIPLRNEPT
jgi:hypothetical protein